MNGYVVFVVTIYLWNFFIFLSNMGWQGKLNLTKFPSNVQWLQLHSNNLHGELTNESIGIGHMEKIKLLSLYNNNFSGVVDWELLGTMTELKLLRLSENQFSSTINTDPLPTTIEELWLQENNFSGNIENFGHLTSLTTFWIYNNSLNGTVDWSHFQNLHQLTEIQMQHNCIRGNIDLSFIEFDESNLILLYGNDNSFDSTINLGAITSTTQSVYFHNNPFITGGVNFDTIASTSDEYPQIWLDNDIYCDTDVYCATLSCAIPQNRDNPSDGYCSGKTNCENTCGVCVACPTISPSIRANNNHSIDTPTMFPLMKPSSEPTSSSPRSRVPTIEPTNIITTIVTTTDSISNDGNVNTNANSGSLSESHISLLIICGLIAFVVCVIACVICVVYITYTKHKEKIGAKEFAEIQMNRTQFQRQASNSGIPSVASINGSSIDGIRHFSAQTMDQILQNSKIQNDQTMNNKNYHQRGEIGVEEQKLNDDVEESLESMYDQSHKHDKTQTKTANH